MKIAIIGAGFTGLSAGYYLSQKGHSVTIFEKESRPGGLAIGYKKKKWAWALEKHYHHLFTSDRHILNLAREVDHKVAFTRPETNMLVGGGVSKIDSPIDLLKFSHLSPVDRIRTGVIIAFLKINPFWKVLEGITAKEFLVKTTGKKSWNILWQPLFVGKFGDKHSQIPASWFWSRIKKRSTKLGYPDQGFEELAVSIAKRIKSLGGQIMYTSVVAKVSYYKKFKLEIEKNKKRLVKDYDIVINTLPFPLFTKIMDTSLKDITGLKTHESIGAINLVLRLKKPFLKDTYWLNINEKNFPFMVVVEHTNFANKKNYKEEHLVYVGKYLPNNHKYFSLTAKQLLKIYSPYLQKINKHFEKDLIGIDIFKAPFSQPIVPLNYSKKIPQLQTSIPGLFIATIQQVYPWDRGTNYAVEMGRRVADIVDR